MQILSLFDGMSCGYIALKKAGMKIDRYVAYEIDKYAIEVSKCNFPDIERHGSVFEGDFKQYEGFDMVMGGSPCIYWSLAQRKHREMSTQGMGWDLFMQYRRAIVEVKPKYFIYENNKSMSQTIRDEISNIFGFEPIMINSKLVSAQNRERLYWVGVRNEDGTYSKCNIDQPEDRKIYLKNIIFSDNKESKGINHPVRVGGLPRPNGEISQSQGMRIYSINGKSVVLGANGGGLGGKTGLYAIPFRFGHKVEDGWMEYRGVKCPTYLGDGRYIIRNLSVRECMKLQTIPEGYSMSCISDSQAYRCLGNGWTVDVIVHILESLKIQPNI